MKIETSKALNKLAKWRAHFCGWQLGTRASLDPEAQAVRDHREVTIMLRAEVNALTKLLLDKRIITAEELDNVLRAEAEAANRDMETRFPGVTASEAGLHYDLAKCLEHMKHWKP